MELNWNPALKIQGPHGQQEFERPQKSMRGVWTSRAWGGFGRWPPFHHVWFDLRSLSVRGKG